MDAGSLKSFGGNYIHVRLYDCFCRITEYEIATITANTDNASTSENAWIVLEGRKARSKEFVLENKKKKFLRQDFKNTLTVTILVWFFFVFLF